MTCKLLLVEVTDELRRADRGEWFFNETQAGSLIHASEPTMFSHPICKVHELPSAEELGRVALRAYDRYRDAPDVLALKQFGQTILDALPKRTKGG